MAWGGIIGKSLTADQFEKYVGALQFGVWRPRFVVVHNTSVPNTATWQGWQARKPPLAASVVKVPGVNHLLAMAVTGEADEYEKLPVKQVSPGVSSAVVDWLKKTLLVP